MRQITKGLTAPFFVGEQRKIGRLNDSYVFCSAELARPGLKEPGFFFAK